MVHMLSILALGIALGAAALVVEVQMEKELKRKKLHTIKSIPENIFQLDITIIGTFRM